MFCDPKVSRTKFERELAEFRAHADIHYRRGIWIMDATFPDVFAVLVAVQPKPCPVVAFGVVVNFDNYDVEPPSVQLVHPLTRVPLKRNELPHQIEKAGLPVMHGPIAISQKQPLVQGWDGQLPFICLLGVREYHKHPAHTGDSWWLHRKSGHGRLSTILDVLATYAIDPVKGFNVQMQFHLSLAVPEIPA